MRKPLTPERWHAKVRRFKVEPPPAHHLRRIVHDLDVYISQAQDGSTRHAHALLACFLAGTKDARLLAHLEAARVRYEADAKRDHRRIERALWLLNPRGGVSREQRGALTEDAIIEARLLSPQLRAAHLKKYGSKRAAEKFAVSKIATALKVSTRTVRQALKR